MARVHTRRLFFWDVSIRNSLRSNKNCSCFPCLLVCWLVGLLVCGYIDVGPSNATERAWISAARAAVAAPIYALHPPLPASKAVLSLLSLLVICPLIPPGEVQAGTEISRWCQLSGCGISSYHALYKYQVHL